MLEKHFDYKIINVDSLTYSENLEDLKDIADKHNYTFIKADIRDREKRTVLSHVDRSIEGPEVF